MMQTELTRVKEVDVCREQLTLMPTEWDSPLSVQERLAIEDVANRRLFLPIFVYKSEKGERLIFYGNNFYKSLRELCTKYNEVIVPIFEFRDKLDGVKQFVIWVRLVLRRNVKRSELRSLKNLLKLEDLDEDRLREALGPLAAFIELPPPRREELPRETQPQVPPPPPPPLEEVLKIREAVRVAEKIERLGEKGRQLIERIEKLDEKKIEKLMPILTEEQKVDIVSEMSKLPEKTLKTMLMLANSPHFGNIVELLDSLYEHLSKIEALLREVARRPEVLDAVVDLLRSKLLNELLRHKDAWTDLAYWLSKFKSTDELIDALQ